ncbi:hypothetical protein [Coleofasciculus sp.]
MDISSEQDARSTARLSPLLILRFKCRTAYSSGMVEEATDLDLRQGQE